MSNSQEKATSSQGARSNKEGTGHGVFLDLYARFEARSRGGLHTLDCELLEDGNSVYLEYVIVAPFMSRGERRRQTWCWSSDYPKEQLMKEAKKEAHKLACQMWGEQPLHE